MDYFIRSESVFQSRVWGDRLVDVVAAGSVGGLLVTQLAKLGVQRIRVWDDDIVEAYNVGNQVYGPADVGRPKVEALADLVLRASGTSIEARNEKATPTTTFGELVFFATDTMDSRTQLFAGAVREKTHILRFFDGRMGLRSLRSYSINPNIPQEIRGYTGSLYTDAQGSGMVVCGSRTTVGPYAIATCGYLTNAFLGWWGNWGMGGNLTLPNETIATIFPPAVVNKVFR